MKQTKILNIGCGVKKECEKEPREVCLDKYKLEGVDIVWDLEKIPIKPLKNNSFDEIRAYHILEQGLLT